LVDALGKVYQTVLSIYSTAESEAPQIVIPKNSVLICSKSTKQEAVSLRQRVFFKLAICCNNCA